MYQAGGLTLHEPLDKEKILVMAQAQPAPVAEPLGKYSPRRPSGTAASRHSKRDGEAYEAIESSFLNSKICLLDKLEAFPRFVSKRSMARFMAKEEIYRKIVNIHGSIVECGVFNGAGLFTWAQLSNIFEPSNYTRKIIGFDTFDGFPSVHWQADGCATRGFKVGDLRGSRHAEINESVAKNNHERHLSHIDNVELVKGDFLKTGPAYINKNQQLLVSLLYLDFDLFEPTVQALRSFLPRMCKGSIVCFDEANCENFPGETLALLQEMNLQGHALKRFSYDPWISYIEI
jgi:hypothetical protein